MAYYRLIYSAAASAMAGIKAALEISEVGEPVVLVVVVEVVAVAVEVLVGEAVAAAPVLERRLRLPHVAHHPLVRRVDPLEVHAVVVLVAVPHDVRMVLQREAVEGPFDLAPGVVR